MRFCHIHTTIYLFNGTISVQSISINNETDLKKEEMPLLLHQTILGLIFTAASTSIYSGQKTDIWDIYLAFGHSQQMYWCGICLCEFTCRIIFGYIRTNRTISSQVQKELMHGIPQFLKGLTHFVWTVHHNLSCKLHNNGTNFSLEKLILSPFQHCILPFVWESCRRKLHST